MEIEITKAVQDKIKSNNKECCTSISDN